MEIAGGRDQLPSKFRVDQPSVPSCNPPKLNTSAYCPAGWPHVTSGVTHRGFVAPPMLVQQPPLSSTNQLRLKSDTFRGPSVVRPRAAAPRSAAAVCWWAAGMVRLVLREVKKRSCPHVRVWF